MLNYANLNDVEFEYLCQDIMQKKLTVELHRFARGKDKGIDLADDVHTKNIIVQVKHYMASSVSQLITKLFTSIFSIITMSWLFHLNKAIHLKIFLIATFMINKVSSFQ